LRLWRLDTAAAGCFQPFTVFVDGAMSVDDEEESPRERMVVNVIIAVFLVTLVGGGILLANAMVSLRKDQDCVLSGRRNCVDVPVPARERW
jgi:hypothetical protein